MFYEGCDGIEQIRIDLFGILAAALICAIVTAIMGEKGANAALTKLITGLFLAFTLIKPAISFDFIEFTHLPHGYNDLVTDAVAEGEQQTKTALARLIKQRTCAYILDKAQALNVALEVEVTLSDDDIPVPEAVRLKGKVSPYAKGRLQTIIAEDLGIEKERQTWT